jgi:phosphatidylserine decarboxylase
MRLHREGKATILLVLLLGSLSLAAGLLWLPPPANTGVALLVVALWALVLWFFRVPERPVAMDDAAVLSPCDGKVVVVEEVDEQEYFKERRLQVSIFMSPLNVHINYHPVSGTAAYKRYHPGKYLVAWHPKSSTDNERCTLVVRHDKHGDVLMRQIAGALARRIVTYPEPGEAAVQGREFGFIKFGSRVDLFLPLNAKMLVNIGQKVQGGTTVIARWGA